MASAFAISGFDYLEEQLSAVEETQLIREVAALPLEPFEFHGYLAARRVNSFGWRYDYAVRRLQSSAPLPEFLQPLRERVAEIAQLPADAFEQTLVSEYAAGAGIGWHKDKPAFGQVIAVSLGSGCLLRFRTRHGAGWRRFNLKVSPRSFYRLNGAAREQWEHSIPAVPALRYSITFRTLVTSRS